MIKFKDREADYKNRRRLVIQDSVKDYNGEIKELVVDVYRGDEGTVYEEGTPIQATNLNTIFNGLNSAIKFLFKEYFTVEELSAEWVQQDTLNTTTFTINLKESFDAVLSFDNDFIEGTIDNKETVIITETEILNKTTGSGTKTFGFYLNINYKDDDGVTYHVTKLNGFIEYTYKSTNPSD